jgi:hypothetical protein
MTREEFEPKYAAEYVEFKPSGEHSVDTLYRQGFRNSFQIHWLAMVLERWDHRDGRYKLVVYQGGGLYMCEDVHDPQWKGLIDLIYGEDEPPIVFVSEDWFQLEVTDPAHAQTGAISVKQLSPEEIPATFGEWKEFLRQYDRMIVDHGRCTIVLRNGRSGQAVFSNTLRENGDDSVTMLARIRPGSSIRKPNSVLIREFCRPLSRSSRF